MTASDWRYRRGAARGVPRAALGDLRSRSADDDIAELRLRQHGHRSVPHERVAVGEGFPERVVVLRGCQRVELIQSRDRRRRSAGARTLLGSAVATPSRAVTFQIRPRLCVVYAISIQSVT